LIRPVGPEEYLIAEEVYVASLLGEAKTLSTILETSLLSEDETLRRLARLVTLGIVAICDS
jgi:hypothetical protein